MATHTLDPQLPIARFKPVRRGEDDLERKTIEPPDHAVKGGNVQELQQSTSQSPWDAETVLHMHQAAMRQTLGDADIVS